MMIHDHPSSGEYLQYFTSSIMPYHAPKVSRLAHGFEQLLQANRCGYLLCPFVFCCDNSIYWQCQFLIFTCFSRSTMIRLVQHIQYGLKLPTNALKLLEIPYFLLPLSPLPSSKGQCPFPSPSPISNSINFQMLFQFDVHDYIEYISILFNNFHIHCLFYFF